MKAPSPRRRATQIHVFACCLLCISAEARGEEASPADDAPPPPSLLAPDGTRSTSPLAETLDLTDTLIDDDRVRTFVARLDSVAIPPSLVDTLVDIVVGTYSEDVRRQVVGPRDVAAVLDWKRTEAMLGCDDDCASEIGAALDVERLVVGTLRAVGTDMHASMRELDLRTGEPKASIEDVLPLNDVRALVYGMRRIAQRLRDSAGLVRDARVLGALSVDTPTPGALVAIDDTPVGSTPLTASALSPGLHAIRIEQAGARAEFVITVIARKKTDIVVDLVATEPSFALRDAHASRVRAQTSFGIAKLACAGAYGCAGTSCALLFLFGAFQGWADSASNAIPSTLGILAGLVPATVLLAWGVADLITLPEAPTGPVPIHRVTITPPEGHGRIRVLPVRDTRDAALAY